MPTPTKGPRLGGGPSHERLIIANLARALFTHGRIRTTHAKAKRLRPQAEKLITFAKRGDVAARRQVLTVVRDKAVVHTLFADIAPRFANREGGYTRILKLGPRPGDAAPMALIELVEQGEAAAEGADEPTRRRRFGRGRRHAHEAPEGANRAQRRAAARGKGGAAAAAAAAAAADEEASTEAALAGEDEEEAGPAVPSDEELAAELDAEDELDSDEADEDDGTDEADEDDEAVAEADDEAEASAEGDEGDGSKGS